MGVLASTVAAEVDKHLSTWQRMSYLVVSEATDIRQRTWMGDVANPVDDLLANGLVLYASDLSTPFVLSKYRYLNVMAASKSWKAV